MTLEVPLLTIPRNANDPNRNATIAANGYEWTIPSGWSWPDNSISNGTPRLFSYPTYNTPNRIQVTPPASACAGGATPVVRVRAVDTECLVGAQAGYVPTKSAERTLNINCITPPLVIASNRTPQGGPIVLFCGEKLENEKVRPLSMGVPSGGTFSNYVFSVSGIVHSFCCLNSDTPGVYVTGPGTGSIGLTATYTRNGASTIVVVAATAVTVRAEMAPVSLQPIPNSCLGQTIRVQVDPAPGATSYTWSIPYPFSPQGSTTTTLPFLDITSSATALSRDFTIGVATGSNGSGCTASTSTGIVGVGSSVSIVPDASYTDTEICANTSFALSAGINDYRYIPNTTYTYDWTVTQRNGQTGATATYSASGQTIQVTSPGTGDWLDVGLRVSTSCGDFFPTSQSW